VPIQALRVVERRLHGLNVNAENDHDAAMHKSKRGGVSRSLLHSDGLFAKGR
jgi:hypothetical protein